MTHITAWIAALTLTGSPLTTSVCATVCGHESSPVAHCHESLTESASPALSGEATCAAATGDTAFIKEDVAAPQAAGIPGTPRLASCRPELTHSGRSLDIPAVTGWLTAPLVLRV